MTILMPIGGSGIRFVEKGYTELKPFIEINKIPMIEYSISSLGIKGHYVIVGTNLQPQHNQALQSIFDRYNLSGTIIDTKTPTSGATQTCCYAESVINPTEPLFIVNCDQYTPWDSEKFLSYAQSGSYDMIVTTYDFKDYVLGGPAKYSFIKKNDKGLATQFAEKVAISDLALNGIHFWQKAETFFKYAHRLLSEPNQTGEQYISHTFNYMIQDGLRITNYPMKHDEYYSLGTPEDVENFLQKIKTVVLIDKKDYISKINQ